jgi:hypothetical protein
MWNLVAILVGMYLMSSLLPAHSQPAANSLTTSFSLCTDRYIRARYEGRLLLIGATDDNQVDGSVSTNLKDCGLVSQGWHYVLTLDPQENRQLQVSYDISGRKSCQDSTLISCGCHFSVDPSGVLNQVCDQCAFQCDQPQSVIVTVNVVYFANSTSSNSPTMSPGTTDDHGGVVTHQPRIPTARPTQAPVPLDYYSSGVYWACNSGGFEIFYENGVVYLAAEDAVDVSASTGCGAHEATRSKHVITTISKPEQYTEVWIHAETQFNNYACHASADLTFPSTSTGNGLIRSCQSGYTSLAITISAVASPLPVNTFTNTTTSIAVINNDDPSNMETDYTFSTDYVIIIVVFVLVLICIAVGYAFHYHRKRNFRLQYQDLSGEKLDELIELAETA